MSRKVIRRKNAPEAASEAATEADAAPAPVAAPAPPPAPPAPKPKKKTTANIDPDQPDAHIDLDDLAAIADMDPAEIAALMDGAVRTRVEVGDEVTGTVTRVGRDEVYVDVGGKSEATIDRAEVPDVRTGETVTAYVVDTQGSWLISKKLRGAAAGTHLETARENNLPVEGKVLSRNKGGYTVMVGDVTAFCPISHISRLPLSDPDAVLNADLEFRVLETGDKVVLSRRALEEEEAEEQATRFWAMVTVDGVYTGTVRNVQPFGAFVDLGGVDGLIPNRESSWGRGRAEDVVQVGQTVQVRVIEIDRAAKKLTLSLKNPDDSPWSAVGSRFVAGGTYPGTVTRVAEFGAFVALAPGLEGLIHISRLGGDAPPTGSDIDVLLVEVDHERQRLALSLVGDTTVVIDDAVGSEVTGTVTEVKRQGMAVTLEDGRQAWLPASEADLPAGTVVHQRFRRGRDIKARIRSTQGNRITLTQREGGADSDQSWRRQLGSGQQAGGFGTMADLFAGLNDKK